MVRKYIQMKFSEKTKSRERMRKRLQFLKQSISSRREVTQFYHAMLPVTQNERLTAFKCGTGTHLIQIHHNRSLPPLLIRRHIVISEMTSPSPRARERQRGESGKTFHVKERGESRTDNQHILRNKSRKSVGKWKTFAFVGSEWEDEANESLPKEMSQREYAIAFLRERKRVWRGRIIWWLVCQKRKNFTFSTILPPNNLCNTQTPCTHPLSFPLFTPSLYLPSRVSATERRQSGESTTALQRGSQQWGMWQRQAMSLHPRGTKGVTQSQWGPFSREERRWLHLSWVEERKKKILSWIFIFILEIWFILDRTPMF